MSTRRGNNGKKGQKYQNTKAFKNDLHDTSKGTKQINGLIVGGVCARCREIIEWRKKFKKYKPLTAPKKCVRCEQKAIKHAYHTVCSRCAEQEKVCEKCGHPQEIVAKDVFRHLVKGNAEQATKSSTSKNAEALGSLSAKSNPYSSYDDDDDDDNNELSDSQELLDSDIGS